MSDYSLVCAHPSSITDITCSTGTLVLVPASVPFDLALLDPAILMQAFGAGFVLVGIPMLIIFGFKQLIKPFWSN